MSSGAVTVTEGGADATFTVKLTSKPVAAVTVTATSAADVQVAAGAGSGLSFSGSQTLTFTVGDWDTVQTVSVRAVDDALDEADSESVDVTLDPASTGDGVYDALGNETVTVTVNDNDATPTATLVLAPSSGSIFESGGVATVTATLSGPSSEAVTLTVSAVSSSDAVQGDFALSAARTLTIAAGQTASTGAVTITAMNNDVYAPDKDKKVTVSATVAGGRGVVRPRLTRR